MTLPILAITCAMLGLLFATVLVVLAIVVFASAISMCFASFKYILCNVQLVFVL